jgi:glutamate carboxypeptidase
VTGRAAHAGLDPEAGASAILELSHVVQELFKLNDIERGVTVNVGTIEGGIRPNVIAPESNAHVDVRVLHRHDAARIEEAIFDLRPRTPGTSLRVEGGFNRPPMERTPANGRLWARAVTLAAELGVEIDEGTAGGGSDGNTTSLFTPTLDGLGAVGNGAHAAHEHVIVERMPERAALLAGLLMQGSLD